MMNTLAVHSTGHVPTLLLSCLLAVAARGCADGEAESAEANGAEHAEEAALRATGSPVVRLDSAALAMAAIRLGIAEIVETSAIPVTGNITFDGNRVSHIGPKTEGRIVMLRVDLGSRVGRGQVLAVLESAEVGATRAELHEAEALLEIARENYEREKRLEEQGISSRKELLEAQAELRRAQAAVLSATERLRVLGAAHREGIDEGGHFVITAPFAGVVAEKHASRGEVVGPTDRIFTVADLSRVWIELDVFERDLPRVAVGQSVTVTTPAYPDRRFSGRIVYVGDVIDPEKRAVRARIEIDNPARALKPGMFATAAIEIANTQPVVVVPRDAVQEVEGKQVVWVPGDALGEFQARPVQLGPAVDDGRIQILAGLSAGDSLVVAGAFTLKSELSKAQFGGHGH